MAILSLDNQGFRRYKMKKIIHFQIPVDEKGEIAVSARSAEQFVKYLHKKLPKYYKIICTPFEMESTGNVLRFNSANIKNSDLWIKHFDEKIKDTLEKDGYLVQLIK
jgi:hypothetical protein